jgi:putative membrane protein
MTHWVVSLLVSSLLLYAVSRIISGFEVDGFGPALIAALVVGFANATLGLMLKILTFPLTILTLGIFWFVINALMLKLAAAFVPGFRIRGFLPAFIAAILLAIAHALLPA